MNIVILEPLGIDEKQLNQLIDKLKLKNHQVTSYSSPPRNEAETIERVNDAEIIILVNYPLTQIMINSAKKLKMISVAFTGYDHIDTRTCKENNIIVCNSAGYATNSVAELTFGLIIGVLRNITACNKATRQGKTRSGLIGNELNGKTLGVIGTGAIGLKVAEIGKAFDCRILGYSRTQKPEANKLGLKYADLKTLLKESDIISIHTPLTDDTKNLIDIAEFKLMKPTAIFIQTSRGGTVNETALAEALNSETIAGAGIDVFTHEPPLDLNHPLVKAKNTVLTPHVAFATKEALSKRAQIAFANIEKWLTNQIQNRVA